MGQNLNAMIETGVHNTVKQAVDNRQAMILNFSGATINCPNRGGIFEFDQKMVIKSISKNIATNILDNIADNVVDVKLEKEITNKGIAELEGANLTYILIFIGLIVGAIMLSTIIGYYLQTPEEKQMMLNTVENLSGKSMTNKIEMGNIENERLKNKNDTELQKLQEENMAKYMKLLEKNKFKTAQSNAKRFYGGVPPHNSNNPRNNDRTLMYVSIIGVLCVISAGTYYKYTKDVQKICNKYGLDDETCKEHSLFKYLPF